MRKISILILLSISYLSIFAQSNEINCRKNLLIMSYNVENLFDTIDDPHKVDNDFLPTSKKKWTSKYYYEKLDHLSKVISAVDPKKVPELLALVEIENKTVLQDLANQKALKKGKYSIVHHVSPDRRGIDVALLYMPKRFKLIYQHFYKVEIKGDNYFKTREILYAKGIFKPTGDTLHIFVNHWPSRRGGQEKSEPKRFAAAQVLRNATDSIFLTNTDARILIMGDFNDEPQDKSINKVLKAKAVEKVQSTGLYNLSLAGDLRNDGTYHYWKTKEWNMLDQLIVSGYLINAKSGLQLKNQETQILRKDFFLYKNKDGVMTPAKTYGGKKYYGGYSDHLPIYFYLYYKCKKIRN